MFSYHTTTPTPNIQTRPLATQQEELTMSGGEGRKRSQSKNMMPVSVRMIMQYHEEDGPLQVCGVEVGMVTMVVQIRKVMKGDVSIIYVVEDDTGRMEAVHYDDENTVPAMVNTFVKIIGVLKTGREQNMVTVYRLTTIKDMNEVTAHQLELVATTLRIRKQQMMAASIAHASFAGVSMVNMTGQAGDHRQKHHHALAQQSQGWYNQAFSQPSKPAAVVLLRTIKSSLNDVGISRKDLHAVHRIDLGTAVVDEMLEYLAMEGHIYTTVDQHHFKSTDA